ncbi:MAG: hypothetical protein MK078_16055 [Crocinitomicaceae bacterium]|nr:hypothetical protein [Crocinitomicaceae bacterium]
MRSLFILILFFSFRGLTQQNFWSLELGSSGGIASINFEHKVLDKDKLDIHMRYGFSLAPVNPNNGTNLVFPIMGHFIYGAYKHKLDLGIGQALSLTT